jgi:hypothetical protein
VTSDLTRFCRVLCVVCRPLQAEAVRLLDTQLSKSAEAVRKEQVSGERVLEHRAESKHSNDHKHTHTHTQHTQGLGEPFCRDVCSPVDSVWQLFNRLRGCKQNACAAVA